VTAEEFARYRHQAVHALQDLNRSCNVRFGIGHWERWDYDLDEGTLVFSQDGVPRVIADIQVVGTTSKDVGTWLWGWANESLPSLVTARLPAVRDFGTAEGVSDLTEPELPDDEYLGWKLTAVAAKILGASGAYRCPASYGFIYFVYTDIRTAELAS
jgi:hypothetical protein